MSAEIAKVFLADDCEGDGMLLRLAFSGTQAPIEVIQAFDGAQAMDLLVTAASTTPFPYALIILDLNMPRMNGIEVLGRLKEIPQLANIPIVVLTSSTNPKDKTAVITGVGNPRRWPALSSTESRRRGRGEGSEGFYFAFFSLGSGGGVGCFFAGP